MLKDRRELIEAELRKATDTASHMYLDSVLSGETLDLEVYEQLKVKIAGLRFDLMMVKQLIDDGHA
jgi:hypothetical protein